MKILNIISILLMVILLSNCDRKNKEPLYCLMQQEFKDYIAFAPGSYWVYKNSLGGKDSVVLTNQEIIKVEEDFNHNISEELHQIFIINNTDTIYMYSGLYSFPNCIYIYKPSTSSNFFNIGIFFYPANISQTLSDFDLTYTQFLDTLSINSILYNKVKIYKYGGEIYYYANKFGLIKKETDSQIIIWELINYNVNQ